MEEINLFPVGDQAVTLSLGETIHPETHRKIIALQRRIRNHPFAGLTDVIISYSSLTVFYDLVRVSGVTRSGASAFVKQKIREAYENMVPEDLAPSRHVRIPVCYEPIFGPDISFVCETKNLSSTEVVALHTSRVYDVYLVGFLPGFPYLGILDERLTVPRKNKPRAVVESGSVGLAGNQTGIYPVTSPGGWQIIGRTPLPLFVPHKHPPVRVEAGDTVQFYSITPDEFHSFSTPNE